MRSLRSPFARDFDRRAASDLAATIRAVADPYRLQLLGELASRPRSNTELQQLLGLSPAVIAHHVRILKAAGLILSRRRGAYVLRALDVDVFDALAKLLTPGSARS